MPLLRSFLTIACANDWELEDTEGVGTYDFNGLVYDEGGSRLRVHTNIPLELSAAVSRLDVRVELTCEQIGFRPVRYFPGGADMRRSGRTD